MKHVVLTSLISATIPPSPSEASSYVPCGLVLVVALTSFFIGKFVGPKYLTMVLVLERVGVFFFFVTSFFVAILISFPLCLRVIMGVAYVVSFLLVAVCNYFYD